MREPRLRLLVVCGGERTEPAYFRGLKGHLRNPAIQIKVKARVRAPEDLVSYARSIAPAGGDEFDQVWCVVDVDNFDLEPAETFADFEAGVTDALRCAERLDPTGCDHGRDPSTGVWRLVRRIMEGGQIT